MLIDTHCHINIMIKKEFDVPLEENFKDDATQIIEEAQKAGVEKIINVGTSLVESINCIKIAQVFDGCFATIGIHPNDITKEWKNDIKAFEELLKNPEHKIVGIGEIGLDYHYEGYKKDFQYAAFKEQIECALKHRLPIIIHTRDASDEVLTILDSYKHDGIKGIIHCFSEDQTFADKALDLGFVLGIGGPLTYPQNNTLRAIFSTAPLQKIVLETDSPFLPPQSIRGKRNSPTQIKTIAQALADLRNISIDDVAKTTSNTVKNLFKI